MKKLFSWGIKMFKNKHPLHIIRIMRLTFCLLLLFTGITFANNAHSQNMRISLNKQGVKLMEVLEEIETQTDYLFISNRQIDLSSEVSIKVKDKPVDEVLDMLLKNKGISYAIEGVNIILTQRNYPVTDQEKRQIAGVVKDQNNEPIIGANVVEEGTTNGSITDVDGAFTLSVSDQARLRISYIGYHSQTVATAGKNSFEIVLIEDTKTLDEVVVIGYGTVKKSDLTGAVASVNSDNFNKGGNTSISQLLSGKASGVQITQTSAEPGGGARIRIRGASSVNAANEPLYVIDGLPIDNSPAITSSGLYAPDNRTPRNPLNTLNPADIESIEILKDASAAAIYGSRGANGVILVTTKRGGKDNLRVDYNYYVSTQTVAKKLKVMNTEEYIRVANELQASQGLDPLYSQEDIQRIGKGTDWQDEIFRNGLMQNHNVSLSGGSEKSNYYVSLNYFDQQGVVLSSHLKRYTAKINFEHRASDKFKFGVNFNTSWLKDQYAPMGISINANAGAIASAILMPPVYPLYDDDGNLFQTNNIDLDNPVALAKGIDSREETERTFGTLFAEYNIIPDLSLRVNLGTDRRSARKDVYNSTLTKQGKAQGGAASVINSKNTSYLIEATLNYSKEIGDHNFNLLAGYTFEEFASLTMSGNITNLPDDQLKTNKLSLGDTDNDNLDSNKAENKLSSYIGRVNYVYKGKYLLTASLRADGSSRFGANNKFAYFPSTALAWHAGREDFIADLNVFHSLKLRGSWGMTGNQSIGNYNSISTFASGGLTILGNTPVRGISPARIANSDLKWETTTQLNLGVDMSFWEGRLQASIDYFNKKTTDILLHLPVPPSSGFNTALRNIGSMQNTGFELMLDSRNIVNKNFTWNTSFNISTLRNKVLDIGPLSEILSGDVGFTTNFCIIKEGYPLNAYYGYKVTGIFQEGDDIANSAQPNAQPGYPIFENTNPEVDNRITAEDRVILGDPFPDFTFGLSNAFTFGDFDFNFFVQGEMGAEILNQNLVEALYPFESIRNRYAEPMLNRWTPENTDTKWPSGINPTSYGGGPANSLTIEDASFIRLKSVELGYNFYPQGRLGKIFKSARVYLTGQNLYVWTKYMGYDPEVSSLGDSNVKYDYNSYPSARSFLFGINLSF